MLEVWKNLYSVFPYCHWPWPELEKINILNWICFTWYNFWRRICCIHQAITAHVTITGVSVTDWVSGHKQKQQYHWAGHSHPHWSVAHRLKRVLSSVQHVYFSSHFWLHDIISPLQWSISERGLVTSPLAGCRSSTGVRASVSVSWVSHLTACHTRLTSARRQTLHYGTYFFAALLFSAGKEGFEKWH